MLNTGPRADNHGKGSGLETSSDDLAGVHPEGFGMAPMLKQFTGALLLLR